MLSRGNVGMTDTENTSARETLAQWATVLRAACTPASNTCYDNSVISDHQIE